MLIKIVIVVLCSLATFVSAQAQSSLEYGLSRSIRIAAPAFKQPTDVEGSPYVPGDDMQNGWIINGTKRIPAKLHYNSYTGEIEYVEGDKIMTPANSIAEFAILAPDTMYFQRGFPSTGLRSATDFYQIIFNGRKTKLLRYVVSSIKNNTDAMSNDYGKKKFQKREEYYVWVANVQPPAENYFLKLSEGDLKPITASKKSLISLFPQNAERIDQYLSEQKIKLKSWAEFASVLRYLETL